MLKQLIFIPFIGALSLILLNLHKNPSNNIILPPYSDDKSGFKELVSIDNQSKGLGYIEKQSKVLDSIQEKSKGLNYIEKKPEITEIDSDKQYYNNTLLKTTALLVSLVDLIISLVVWIQFNNSSKYFQFIQEHYNIGYYDFYLGIDGLSIYFVLLTTLIIPISIISNWKSINHQVVYFLSIMLLLESLLLLIYMVLDLLMFYIFFESILAPLFLLIGIFGSIEKQRASFYFFLYTFLGSLFMLLSIITISYLSGCTDINIVSRNGFVYITQLLIFLGIFIAFAVKTPVIYLNGWLLKAHVESPLSGSIILAAVVLKLSLYGIFRLILIISPKAYIVCTYVIFTIGVITIIYASLSTLRTIDIKELIAYSSVSHAAVYFIGVFSNVIQGIIGGICLGLAHGFVSSGLFTIAGGVLYDRSGTRLISSYRGLVQAMPILSILFFILCLGNCGAPLTLNFIGEFMSLYGVFERLPLAGVFASSSIVFSAAFTIFMFNRIIFGGSLYRRNWIEYLMDLNIREYSILLILVIFTILLGVYPSIITDGLSYVTTGLLYNFDSAIQTNSFEIYALLPATINQKTIFYKKQFNPEKEEKEKIFYFMTLIIIFCFIISINYNIILCAIYYIFLFNLFCIKFSGWNCNIRFFDLYKLNYHKLIFLVPVIIIFNNGLINLFVNNEYNTYQILFLVIMVTIIIVFQIFNCFIIENKISFMDKVWSIYNYYKNNKFKTIIFYFIRNKLPVLILTILPTFLIRVYCFPLSNNTINLYLISISVLLVIILFYMFIVNIFVKEYSNKEAFLKALESVVKLYSPVNILIGLILFFIIFYIKFYLLFWYSWICIYGFKIQIPWFKLGVNVNNLFKFYLENRHNFVKLNFAKIKYANLFKSITDITFYTLTYHCTLKNRPITSIWSNVLPNANPPILDETEEDRETLMSMESSPDIEPSEVRLTYDEVLMKLQDINNLSNSLSNDIERGYPNEYINQRMQQIYKYKIAWSEYIVRHHMYRDTDAGLVAYSNLVYWACGRGLNAPAIKEEEILAKKALCQDPNLSITIEKLKSEPSINNLTRSILIAKAPKLLEELKEIRNNLTEEETKVWSFKSSGLDIRAYSNGWAAGTLGLEKRNNIINCIAGGDPLNILLRNEPSFPHQLRLNSSITEVTMPSGIRDGFIKYKYRSPINGRESFWYVVDDVSLSWQKNFDPNEPNNSKLAFNLSKILEDRLNSGYTSYHDIMDDKLVTWCSKAITYGYDKRRASGVWPGGGRNPALTLSARSIEILKSWMPES